MTYLIANGSTFIGDNNVYCTLLDNEERRGFWRHIPIFYTTYSYLLEELPVRKLSEAQVCIFSSNIVYACINAWYKCMKGK